MSSEHFALLIHCLVQCRCAVQLQFCNAIMLMIARLQCRHESDAPRCLLIDSMNYCVHWTQTLASIRDAVDEQCSLLSETCKEMSGPEMRGHHHFSFLLTAHGCRHYHLLASKQQPKVSVTLKGSAELAVALSPVGTLVNKPIHLSTIINEKCRSHSLRPRDALFWVCVRGKRR